MNESTQYPKATKYLGYPSAILALVSLLSVIFTAGIAWSAQSSRLSNIEENYAKKDALTRIETLLNGIDARLERIETKIYK